MEAPDKIYVHVRTEPSPSITFSEIKENNSTNIEYIRKDALLEWIDEYRNYSSGPSWELLKTHIDSL